jgi:hypothetical protein
MDDDEAEADDDGQSESLMTHSLVLKPMRVHRKITGAIDRD